MRLLERGNEKDKVDTFSLKTAFLLRNKSNEKE